MMERVDKFVFLSIKDICNRYSQTCLNYLFLKMGVANKKFKEIFTSINL